MAKGYSKQIQLRIHESPEGSIFVNSKFLFLTNFDCCLHYTSSISLRTVGCCDESERDCLPVRQFILLYFLHNKFTDLISLQSCLVHIY